MIDDATLAELRQRIEVLETKIAHLEALTVNIEDLQAMLTTINGHLLKQELLLDAIQTLESKLVEKSDA